jgi:hypothetical protein
MLAIITFIGLVIAVLLPRKPAAAAPAESPPPRRAQATS